MNLFRIILFLLLIPFIVHSTPLYYPDKSRESMIYEQSLSEIFDGKHLYINYKFGKTTMLEIYDESHNSAVLFLHGRGLSPNEENLANPIRVSMSPSTISSPSTSSTTTPTTTTEGETA